MPANLHDKLINLEVSPPATNWENISKRLDEEFDVGEIRLSQKLMNATAMPPDNVWEDIAAAIPARQKSRRAALIIPMKWRRIAVAAILLGFVATAIIYFVNSGTETPNVTVAINPPHPDSNKKAPEKTPEPAIVMNPVPAPTIVNTPAHPTNPVRTITSQNRAQKQLRRIEFQTTLMNP